MFQKLDTTFSTTQRACKLYVLLHTKKRFVNKLIHCLAIGSNVLSTVHLNMIVHYSYIDISLCCSYVIGHQLGVLG